VELGPGKKRLARVIPRATVTIRVLFISALSIAGFLSEGGGWLKH